MAARAELPDEWVRRLRSLLVNRLPECVEENAWVGVRSGVGRATIARVFGGEDGLCRITFRAELDEVMAFEHLGHPTGSGKSAVYQLAGSLTAGVTVVVSPLIALQEDQLAALRGLDVGAAGVLSSLRGPRARRAVLDRLAGAELEFLLLGPEQLADDEVRRVLNERSVDRLAVDEAHCIDLWGPDLRPDFLSLGAVRHSIGSPPVLAMTASAPPHVRDEIINVLKMDNPAVVLAPVERRNIDLSVRHHATRQDLSRPSKTKSTATAASGSSTSLGAPTPSHSPVTSIGPGDGCSPITALCLDTGVPMSTAPSPQARRSSSPPTPSDWELTRRTSASSSTPMPRDHRRVLPGARPRRPGRRPGNGHAARGQRSAQPTPFCGWSRGARRSSRASRRRAALSSHVSASARGDRDIARAAAAGHRARRSARRCRTRRAGSACARAVAPGARLLRRPAASSNDDKRR